MPRSRCTGHQYGTSSIWSRVIAPGGKPERSSLRFVTLGTVEPRKNFVAAAEIVAALREQGFVNATLDIVGRRGWGDDWESARTTSRCCSPRLSVHGARQTDHQRCGRFHLHVARGRSRAAVARRHNMPGLPIVAPDDSVFREVLVESGSSSIPTILPRPPPPRSVKPSARATGAGLTSNTAREILHDGIRSLRRIAGRSSI